MQEIERLKSKKEISFVFDEGLSVTCFPIKLFFIKNDKKESLNVAFTVGKKNIKRAVDRNKIKRLMKEVFRLIYAEDDVFVGHSLVFVCLAKEVVSFDLITKGVAGVLTKFMSIKK